MHNFTLSNKCKYKYSAHRHTRKLQTSDTTSNLQTTQTNLHTNPPPPPPHTHTSTSTCIHSHHHHPSLVNCRTTTSIARASQSLSRVITIGSWPDIDPDLIDQDGQAAAAARPGKRPRTGGGEGRPWPEPTDPRPSDCLGSLTNSIAYQGPIMGTNG